MSLRSQATSNPMLTNFASGLTQDLSSALANFIAPPVRVPSTIGQFKKFDSKNDFQIYETERAMGGGAKRITFKSTDGSYNCKPHALEATIDDAERDAAGDADPLNLEKAKTRTLITTAAISHEVKVFTKVFASVDATAGLGEWSNPELDPVVQIDSLIRAIAIETGMMPNRVAWGLGTWEVFRNHPKVIARQPGAALIGLSLGQAGGLFLNPNMEHKVGILSKDTVKFGKDKNAQNIVGAKLVIFYASPTPDLYDPSFMKTFVGGKGGVDSVRMYRDEGSRSDVVAVDWAEDIQEVAGECARRIDIS